MPKKLVETLKRFALGESSYEHVIRKALTEGQKRNAVRVLIVHPASHAIGAARLEHHLRQGFPAVIDGVSFFCKRLEIKGFFADVESQLCHELGLIEEESGTGPYSFIVTLGAEESSMVQTVREINSIAIPQLYCVPSVSNSISIPFTTRKARCPLSGVFSRPTDASLFVEGSLAIKPAATTVCLLIEDREDYLDDDPLFTAEQEALTAKFRAAGVNVQRHYWSASSPRFIELERMASTTDVFMLFNDSATHAHIDTLTAIAKEYGVLVCAADLDSVIDGAAIGAGVTWAAFAAPLISQMADIVLLQNARFSQPICIPAQGNVHYNIEAMQDQGIVLPPVARALLEMRSIKEKELVTY